MPRGLRIARRLIEDSWDADAGLFDTRPGDPARVLRASDLAVLLDMLREMQLAGDTTALEVLEALLGRVVTVLPFSELDGQGEALGDGLAATDGNGVVEPGANGRAPLLCGTLLEGPERGPDPSAPMTWSRHVLPVFRARCAGCHVDGAAMSGYRVDTPALAHRPGETGIRPIVTDDPPASLLLQKLVAGRPPLCARMPFGRPPLESRDIEVVRRWISGGARDR